jgi:hypothetical protein
MRCVSGEVYALGEALQRGRCRAMGKQLTSCSAVSETPGEVAAAVSFSTALGISAICSLCAANDEVLASVAKARCRTLAAPCNR